jgi:opacity protein-like surface antigen
VRIRPMRFALRVALCAALVSTGGVAAAQETVAAGGTPTSAVRVVKDRATIWTRNPSMVLAVAPVGTVLKAISRDDKWYEVEVPGTLAGRPGGAVGFVLAAHVELVPGAPAPPARAATRSDSQWDPVGAGTGAGTVTSSRPAAPPPAFGIRGFGSLNYMFFNAHDSFEAIFGASSYPFFGGGGEVIFARHFFVSGTVEHFQKTGERVFVSNGEVFKLGLDDKVSITPVSITGGYRLNSADRLVPYVGGGAGIYKFKETSEFADANENTEDTFTSYHALAGVEYGASKWLFAAFEVQYTTVPDALGAPGVSGEFGEKNLGGLSLRAKVLIGR